MKQFSAAASFLLIILGGCQKSGDITQPAATQNVITPDTKPVASFKINNLVDDTRILEGNILDFTNDSKNASSYSWDLGNNVTSTDKIPQGESYVPCGAYYTITLTVKNNAGQTASYSKTYEIQCRGKNSHRSGVVTPLTHLNSEELKHFVAN